MLLGLTREWLVDLTGDGDRLRPDWRLTLTPRSPQREGMSVRTYFGRDLERVVAAAHEGKHGGKVE